MTVRVIPKAWGREEVYADTSYYTGKLLHFERGAESSEHYHDLKHESWLVLSGKFRITVDGAKRDLGEGDTLDLPPKAVHQVRCLKDGVIAEVSTPHDDADVHRLKPSRAAHERAVSAR